MLPRCAPAGTAATVTCEDAVADHLEHGVTLWSDSAGKGRVMRFAPHSHSGSVPWMAGKCRAGSPDGAAGLSAGAGEPARVRPAQPG